MPSQDFVYDLTEKLEEDGIEFALCILSHGKKKSKIDLHLNLKTDESVDLVCRTFESICNEDEPYDDDIEIDFPDE